MRIRAVTYLGEDSLKGSNYSLLENGIGACAFSNSFSSNPEVPDRPRGRGQARRFRIARPDEAQLWSSHGP